MRSMRANIGILKWMFVLLLVVFGVGLVMPGIGNRDLATAAAVVDGEPVPASLYSRQVSARLEQERQAAGGELSEADSLRIRRDTLNSLIDEELAVQHAKSVGQTMSEAEFRDAVISDPSLKDQQGRFDSARYQQILSQQAEQTQQRWQDVEAGFQRGMLLNKVRGFWSSQAVLTPAEAAAAEARFNRQVRAQAAVWSVAKLQSGLKFTEEDLRSYYSQNKQKWAKPELLKLRQILIRADFASGSATAKAKAEGVLAKLKAGADFKALAKTENADEAARKSAGDLGELGRADLRHPELAAAIFGGLKVGQMTGVIGTTEGFHIVKVEGRKEGFEPTFANTKDKVVKELGEQRAMRDADALARKTLAAVKAGKALEAAAKANQGSVSTTGWFGRDDTKALPALGEQPSFARNLLALKLGESLDEPIASKTAVAVAVLSEERPGAAPAKPDKAAERRQAALNQGRQDKTRVLYKAWLESLHQQAVIVDRSGVLAAKSGTTTAKN